MFTCAKQGCGAFSLVKEQNFLHLSLLAWHVFITAAKNHQSDACQGFWDPFFAG